MTLKVPDTAQSLNWAHSGAGITSGSHSTIGHFLKFTKNTSQLRSKTSEANLSTVPSVLPRFLSSKFFYPLKGWLDPYLEIQGRLLPWDLGPCMKCKPCSMLYIKNWKTKQELRILLFRVKPRSDSPTHTAPICKTAGSALKQDVYFLESYWIPAVCFPPEITRRQIHSKRKQ